MSKTALKKYLAGLKKKDLELQILDLYGRFPVVKTYYDFVFNPKEEKLIQEAKKKISNEYFPLKRKRAKARRSVAQKYIKHFTTLGMEPFLIGEFMIFNLETAQRYSKTQRVNEGFYKSMLRSFKEAVHHLVFHSLIAEFEERILRFYQEAELQDWLFQDEFEQQLQMLEMDKHKYL
ncbi:DUF6155 family protein [Muriicola sp.]|uniref:DUF6155 family protein n=1 Tax=Muriicola sp. TaxID=2020856 RepID=UPI003C770405